MKKVVFFGLFTALITTSCSSDDSKFNQSNLVGTWDLKTSKQYSFANDSLELSLTIPFGKFYLTFNANGTYWKGGVFGADTLKKNMNYPHGMEKT